MGGGCGLVLGPSPGGVGGGGGDGVGVERVRVCLFPLTVDSGSASL